MELVRDFWLVPLVGNAMSPNHGIDQDQDQDPFPFTKHRYAPILIDFIGDFQGPPSPNFLARDPFETLVHQFRLSLSQ